MVVVKLGPLPPPGKQYKVYLNEDVKKGKWYLRVTHNRGTTNQHFRAGTYASKEEAFEALARLDPLNPKKDRSNRGTVDQYANGMWRVRVKHRGEHMHLGYFKTKDEAQKKLTEALADQAYLDERYNSLVVKRKRKRELKLKRQRLLDGIDPPLKRQARTIVKPEASGKLFHSSKPRHIRRPVAKIPVVPVGKMPKMKHIPFQSKSLKSPLLSDFDSLNMMNSVSQDQMLHRYKQWLQYQKQLFGTNATAPPPYNTISSVEPQYKTKPQNFFSYPKIEMCGPPILE